MWINNRQIEVDAGSNILEAARSGGFDIPTLCYLKDVNTPGVCRVCLVEVGEEQHRVLQAACVTPVAEGMRVVTDTPRVRRARRHMVELLLSEHHRDCTSCVRNLNCELQSLADKLGVRSIRLQGERPCYPLRDQNAFIVKDDNKCIKCRRCVAVCRDVQRVGTLGAQNRGFRTVIGPAFMRELAETDCISCGQCVLACPTGALTEKESIEEVFRALDDPDKLVVVQTAPSITVTLGEDFGLPVGTVVTGKMVAALRRLGFDRVFSTDFAADITTVEEAHELLERLRQKERLPLISSCSPGWVRFCENFYPEFLPYLSSCKSPQEMMGALVKTYFAAKEGLDPSKIVVVAVMPCTAKKFEAAREEMVTRGLRDVDYVLTTRELARMIRQTGLRFEDLPEEEYDQPLGNSSGAADVFGASGGLTEAAIRTAFALINPGERAPVLELKELRDLPGLKEATIDLKKGGKIKVAVVHGTGNARQALEKVKKGEQYDFIEIMACPGGCVGGGGQPIWNRPERPELSPEHRRKRAEALFKIDLNKELRKAHENPAVKTIYTEFLGHPLSDKAKELLHVHYTPKKRSDYSGNLEEPAEKELQPAGFLDSFS